MSDSKPGPKTPEGKRRSSLNAMKHGLSAKAAHALEALADELGFTYDDVLNKVRTYYFPRDPIEDELVHRIARCIWRLRLSAAMEKRILSRRGIPGQPGTSYEKIMRYERLVDIHLHRALTTLAKKKAAELANRENVRFPGLDDWS